MRPIWTLVAAVITSAACGVPPAPDPVLLFDSRSPLQELRQRLKASGGDPARVIFLKAASDLTRLKTNARYKFVVRADGQFAIAPLPADAPNNQYAHAILADGGPVRAAGGIRIERTGDVITRVILDQDSQSYCPSVDSLREAVRGLARFGVDPGIARIENRPPACVNVPGGAAPAVAGMVESKPRYGELMVEVGRRFELLGRAVIARRYELAAFELDELGEVFAEDLPKAEPPRESRGVNLAGVADSFAKTNLPDLHNAVSSHNVQQITAAFRRAADNCNGCHKISGHAFVEIPANPGASVPALGMTR